jgi:cytochrome c553
MAKRDARARTAAALGAWCIIIAVSAPAASAADPAYGEYLSSECVACHRRDGQDKGIPSIVGWPVDQFVAVLQSYKSKDRQNQVMQTITGRLSDDDMAALAAFYGSLKPPP